MEIKVTQIIQIAFAVLLLQVSLVLGYCEKNCNGHGTCEAQDRCVCYRGRDGRKLYTGNDCSIRTCPTGVAWMGPVQKANDLHPIMECSNAGRCNTATGACLCFPGREGVACERATCPMDCSGQGICFTQKQIAEDNGRVYDTPWDADKVVACVCDVGYRGLDCSQVECPSHKDVHRGAGNEMGRDCSGRGVCDYVKGICTCYPGYYGVACDRITTLLD